MQTFFPSFLLLNDKLRFTLNWKKIERAQLLLKLFIVCWPVGDARVFSARMYIYFSCIGIQLQSLSRTSNSIKGATITQNRKQETQIGLEKYVCKCDERKVSSTTKSEMEATKIAKSNERFTNCIRFARKLAPFNPVCHLREIEPKSCQEIINKRN